jgi:hypothetical protein
VNVTPPPNCGVHVVMVAVPEDVAGAAGAVDPAVRQVPLGSRLRLVTHKPRSEFTGG